MQGAVHHISKACDNFQLTISTKSLSSMPARTWKAEPTITVKGHKLQVFDKTWETLSQKQSTYMMRLQPELPKPVKHLADFAKMSGNRMESDLILILESKGCGTANTLICMCDIDSIPTSCKET